MWNLLGIFYEKKVQYKKDDSVQTRIDYTLPKEYIWLRRRNLYGAKLRIGYVESPPFFVVGNSNSTLHTENELVFGNMVSLNKLRFKYLKLNKHKYSYKLMFN